MDRIHLKYPGGFVRLRRTPPPAIVCRPFGPEIAVGDGSYKRIEIAVGDGSYKRIEIAVGDGSYKRIEIVVGGATVRERWCLPLC